MSRLTLGLLVLLYSAIAWAQTTSQPVPVSDPQALSLVHQSIVSLTRQTAISDVTLIGNVTSIFGSDNETGTGIFQAKGSRESLVSLKLSGETRAEVRNLANGLPSGAWQVNSGAAKAIAYHNCRTDAAWFFPALSSLTQTANPSFVFKYIGLELHGGVNTQHVRVFESSQAAFLQRLSTVDFYLDPISSRPLAIAFAVHPDLDGNTDIPAEVRFANYQSVSGIPVPFHFQKILNGGVVLDVNVTSARFNSGLADSIFSLQ